MGGVTFLLFLMCAGIILITYAVYPLVLIGIGLLYKPNLILTEKDEKAKDFSISIIICAHNEEDVIVQKIYSVISQNFKLPYEIIIASDGSTDTTVNLAESIEFTTGTIKVLDLERNGKWFALNRAVKETNGKIIVFSDADTIWTPTTLGNLVKHFSKEQIGCVAGNVISRKNQKSSSAWFDRIFRKYESVIRVAEENLAGCVSADGGLFAIRKALIEEVPPGVTDDFFLSTGAVAAGKRITFEPDARVLEYAVTNQKKNLSRRIRITVRGLTSLYRRRSLLNPFKHGAYSAALFFHKFLRRFSAVLLLAIFPLSLLLSFEHGAFAALAFVQFIAYSLTALSIWGDTKIPGLGKLTVVVLHILGLAIGFILFSTGKRFDRWSPSRAV